MARKANLKKRPRKRYVHDRAYQSGDVGAQITSIEVGASATKAIVHFDQPLFDTGDGIPLGLDIAGKVLSAPTGNGTALRTLTTSGNIVAGDAWTIARNDPEWRSRAGGYVFPATGVLAA